MNVIKIPRPDPRNRVYTNPGEFIRDLAFAFPKASEAELRTMFIEYVQREDNGRYTHETLGRNVFKNVYRDLVRDVLREVRPTKRPRRRRVRVEW